MQKPKAAARRLFEAHERRERFAPLPPELAPRNPGEAYAIQDAYVARRAERLGAIAGYKIALSSAEMQRFMGMDSPQAGVMLASTLHHTPARVRAADYVRLVVEFEIAVEMAADLPAADAPFTRERVAPFVRAVMPALELADDRNADYSQLPKYPLELIADNAWNEGAVLGVPIENWRALDLAAVRGVATINGRVVGEGVGAAAMGHPLAALAWIANHLAAHGRSLVYRDVVITGSIITTKTVRAGDLVRFSVAELGEVELRVD
ncbi:MAG TPA: fumarylacetoacetate hydrolase family protein [Casimicrobiaceae bacterium]|nr:fumarylacetoacetate hydrolase family protein [Casimicrobiaceae bacterium]